MLYRFSGGRSIEEACEMVRRTLWNFVEKAAEGTEEIPLHVILSEPLHFFEGMKWKLSWPCGEAMYSANDRPMLAEIH